jgi:hypothetical protein
MAWSWSHTQEAYDDAQKNVQDLPRSDLEIIFAEWVANYPRGTHQQQEEEWDSNRYHKALARASLKSDDCLAEFIWENMERLAICDNGGWNAWVCPHGCHRVPFSREEESE